MVVVWWLGEVLLDVCVGVPYTAPRVEKVVEAHPSPAFTLCPSPLMVAVENRSQAVIEWLVQKGGVDVNGHDGRAFRVAAGRGHVETMDRLLAMGADPRAREGGGPGGRGGTALMLGVFSGNPTAVQCIIVDGRYSVNAQDRLEGFTALHRAAGSHVTTMDSARSRQAIICLLLAAGADPTVKDNDGRTPAQYARQRIRGRTPDFVDMLEVGRVPKAGDRGDWLFACV